MVGQVAQAVRRLAMGWTARVQPQVPEGWRFSSLLRVQTGPGVHSASYKMSTGAFPRGVNVAEHRTTLVPSWQCLCVPLHPHPRGPSWPVMEIPLRLPYTCVTIF